MRFIVHTHSFVDLITNSSSELFVCHENRSVETIRKIIVSLAEKYNEKALNDSRKNLGQVADTIDIRHLFTRIFREPYVCPKTYRDEGWGFTVKKGEIILESQDDNSIPWDLQEAIEGALNVTRHHLG